MATPFNFTGREALASKDFEIKPDTRSPRLSVFFKQHLAELKKYAGCEVKLSAYRATKSQRVDLGLIDKIPPSLKVEFDQFPDADGVHFQVKVVEPATKKIRAKIDNLNPPKTAKLKKTKTRGLLPVLRAKANEGLKGRFWNLKFTSDNPILLITNRFPSVNSVNELPFQALAWPAIMKEVLTYAFIVKCQAFPKWSDDWLTLATKVLGVSDGAPEVEPSAKEVEVYLETTAKWIDDVAAAFATKRNLSGITSEFKNGGAK